MKNHRLLLLALGSTLALAPLTRADGTAPATPATPATPAESPRHERRERMREHREDMAKALGLTDDQKARTKAVNQQEKDALKAVKDDTTLTPDQRKQKASGIRKNFADQRKAILTPEQQKKADELKAQAKERHEPHDGPPGGN
jgi:Spy/CpxP family protein refolding chaperone